MLTSTIDKHRSQYEEAIAGLDCDQRRDFHCVMIGALMRATSDEAWARALDIARGVVTR